MSNVKQNLKQSIKSHFPEIIIGATVILGAMAGIYLIKNKDTEILLSLTNNEWTKILSGDVAKIATDFGTLIIVKEIHLPN